MNNTHGLSHLQEVNLLAEGCKTTLNWFTHCTCTQSSAISGEVVVKDLRLGP